VQQEIELKLKISPTMAEEFPNSKFIQQQLVGGQTSQKRIMKNTYFDTPEQNLSELGFALRLRKQDEQWLQTLKDSGKAEAGLHQRNEWEWSLEKGELDLSLLPQVLVDQLGDSINKLQPMFSTDFQRTIWNLLTAEGGQIELALDQGEVKAGSLSELISELELELKAGEQSELLALAEQLQAELKLEPFNQSKAERGYRLFKKQQTLAQANNVK
jgi:triphosphatase